MKLHTNTDLFNEKIREACRITENAISIVERDYWLTDILSKFSMHSMSDKLVIKGGCALKYFYGLTNREVYDIDFVSKDEVSPREIRFLFDDLMYASHFSTGEDHVLQHVRWYPYDHSNLSQEIRMDYYKGEKVFEYSRLGIVEKYLPNLFQDEELCKEYLISSFSLNVMGINNMFVEKALAFSDKYVRNRYPEAEKHFDDLFSLFDSKMIDEQTIRSISKDKVSFDIGIFGREKMDQLTKFEVFDSELVKKHKGYSKDQIEELKEYVVRVFC